MTDPKDKKDNAELTGDDLDRQGGARWTEMK